MFRAGICCWPNQNNLDQGHDLWLEGPDLFVLFEEINDIMQCITHAFTMSETTVNPTKLQVHVFCKYFLLALVFA